MTSLTAASGVRLGVLATLLAMGALLAPAAPAGAAKDTLWKYEIGKVTYNSAGQLSAGKGITACQAGFTSSFNVSVKTTAAAIPPAIGRQGKIDFDPPGGKAKGGFIKFKNAKAKNSYDGFRSVAESCLLGIPVFPLPTACLGSGKTTLSLHAKISLIGRGRAQIEWAFLHPGGPGADGGQPFYAPVFPCGSESIRLLHKVRCLSETTLRKLRPLKGLIRLPFKCAETVAQAPGFDIYSSDARSSGSITLDRLS